jgi:prepilin-type N-terminal cleavage/methylation domain-containing protein
MTFSVTPVCNKKRLRQGMTLVEVMLAAVILAILAVVSANALFYPRLLVVNSGLEQSAINAGIGELERHLNSYITPSNRGLFDTDGWSLNDTPNSFITSAIYKNDYEDYGGHEGEYVEIKTTVEYRDGKTVDLITYRSLQR